MVTETKMTVQEGPESSITSSLRLALYCPDIAANTGAMMRLCACFGVGLDIIEPAGFVLDDKRLRRSGMDYVDQLAFERHASWDAYRAQLAGRRLILLSTKAVHSCYGFAYEPRDVLLVGQESAGVPEAVHQAAAHRVRIPMKVGVRSLNVAMAAALVMGEALRQLGDVA